MFKIFPYKKALPSQKPNVKQKKNDCKKLSDLKINDDFYYKYVNFTGKRVVSNLYPKHNENTYEGCILGGAIGDAYGAPVEFMKLNKIKKIYGEDGLQTLISDENNQSKFTDDTQLTIFTADGLLKSGARDFGINKEPDYNIIYNSYRNWHSICSQKTKAGKGWISDINELLGTGGSGKTCMQTLSENTFGTLQTPLNYSKGCGGVMRVAPVGLMYYKNPKNAFNVAIKCAALTHGHPDAYLSAGVYASIISNIVCGKTLEESIDSSVKILKTYKGHENVLEKINLAKALAKKEDVPPDQAIKTIGKGWVGDEAIAIAIYCALKTPDDWEKAVINSINHDGDSDSVGSITGGLMGALLGANSIPDELKEKIFLKNELKEISNDLLQGPKHIRKAKQKYPSYSPEYNFKTPDRKLKPAEKVNFYV